MTSLLVGCETVLYMANRLKAYMDYLQRLPATLTRTNFETAMTKLYVHILQFLAQAIQIYQTSSFNRTFQAFWKDSDVQEFGKLCDKLGIEVETEASNCDRTLSAQDREGALLLKRDLQKMLKELEQFHKIQESLNRLETKIDLEKLPFVKGAMFNSYGEDYVVCHPATRVKLLRQIQDWARQSHSKSIFWLNGMAGTGKSTISRTFAEWLADQGHLGVIDLGASFFFKRGEADRGSASRFFPTITRQLLSKIPGLSTLITEVIDSDPLICHKLLGEQFDKLVYQPLQKVKIPASACSTLVVVVDALDECEKEGEIRTVLELWSRLPKITTIRLRLFLTSRPELPVRLGFKKMSVDAHQDMVLHEVPRTTIHSDISAFLKDEFLKIQQEYNNDRPSGTGLGHDWPGDKVLQALADIAVPLFIIAATLCRYVGELKRNPQKRLETILEFQRMGAMSQMEQTYLPVLKQITAPTSDSHDQEMLYREFRMIVGAIVLLAEPLSMTSLADLLHVSQDDIWCCLSSLHSVLQVPSDRKTPVRTLHLSFREFLLSDKLRDQPIGVDGPATHRMLLTRCLELLSAPDGLRENLCDLRPGQPRREINPNMINERLSPAFQYACQYWVHHAQHSMIPIHDDDEVHMFLQKDFLHWLEALSLMNRITEVIRHISILQSLVSVSVPPGGISREGAGSDIRLSRQIIQLIYHPSSKTRNE
jgi:hypothetical protein